MLDKTIDSALLNLRRDLIRGDGEGLVHVEALLTLRGVAMPEVRPERAPGCAGQGVMARMVLVALRHRPMTYNDVARCVLIQRPELTYAQALRRTAQALAKLKGKGMAGRDGRVWGISTQNTKNPTK